jgi:hypothetical protein
VPPAYHLTIPTFWRDKKVRRFGYNAKLLAIYLLTAQERAQEGFYWLPLPHLLGDLNWSLEDFKAALAELVEADFADYDDEAEVVFIARALKYHPPAGPAQIKGAVKRVAETQKSPRLFARLLASAEQRAPDFHTALRAHWNLTPSTPSRDP